MDLLSGDSLYNLSLKLCRHLDFGMFLKASREILQEHTPLEKMVLASFYPNSSLFSTITLADRDGVHDISERMRAPVEVIKSLSGMGAPVSMLRRTSGSESAKLLVKRGYLTPDSSLILMRMVMGKNMICLLYCTAETGKEFTREHGTLFAGLRQIFSVGIGNCFGHRNVWTRNQRLRDDLEQRQRFTDGGESELIGAGMGLQMIMPAVKEAASGNDHLVIEGEVGSGRSFMAHEIHSLSSRQNRQIMTVDVNRIPESQLQDYLFGKVTPKGSEKGVLARVSGGTVVLRGIRYAPEITRKMLSEVALKREVAKAETGELIKADVRFFFLEDSPMDDFPLSGVEKITGYIRIPPLRERKEDIPRLISYFMERSCRKLGRIPVPEIARECIDECLEYPWPGNVRELELLVEQIVLCSDTKEQTLTTLSPTGKAKSQVAANLFDPGDDLNLDNLVSNHIMKVMHQTKGKVGGEDGAAHLLGVNPSTLRKRMRKLDIPFGRKAQYRG